MTYIKVKKQEYEALKRENEALKDTKLYKKVLKAFEEIKEGKVQQV